MHSEQRLFDVLFHSLPPERFALFHLKLHTVIKHNEIKPIGSQNLGSDLQRRHHIINEKLLDVFFQQMQFIIFVSKAFHRKHIFGVGMFAWENLPKGSSPDESVFVSETLRLLIEYGILFGIGFQLTENFDNVIKLGRVADFNFDLIMMLIVFLMVFVRLPFLHHNKIVMSEFFFKDLFKIFGDLSVFEDFIDFVWFDNYVLEKIHVITLVVPLLYQSKALNLSWR
jgi:hypothetical protein